jgi:hypothetical protein
MVWPDMGWSGSSVVAAISNFLLPHIHFPNGGKAENSGNAYIPSPTNNLLIVSQFASCKHRAVNDLYAAATTLLPS